MPRQKIVVSAHCKWIGLLVLMVKTNVSDWEEDIIQEGKLNRNWL
jgi:hypothetical protein